MKLIGGCCPLDTYQLTLQVWALCNFLPDRDILNTQHRRIPPGIYTSDLINDASRSNHAKFNYSTGGLTLGKIKSREIVLHMTWFIRHGASKWLRLAQGPQFAWATSHHMTQVRTLKSLSLHPWTNTSEGEAMNIYMTSTYQGWNHDWAVSVRFSHKGHCPTGATALLFISWPTKVDF